MFYILGSLLTAFSLSLVAGGWIIGKLYSLQPDQPVRVNVPKRHLAKIGTPTMGGILILGVMIMNLILWGHFNTPMHGLVYIILLGFGAIGGLDDYRKVFLRDRQHLTAKAKYGLQSLLSFSVACMLYKMAQHPPALIIGPITIELGLLFIPWTYFIMTGSSNAFNLTDGLDGLAITHIILLAFGLGMLGMYSEPTLFENAKALELVCASLVGVGLGFLWFNSYPAQVFMGDIGSLPLGALLGFIAIVLQQELAFAIMALIPVLETLSVILQVLSFKLTGKRIFLMAPFHHHFELKGLSETKIVTRFSIVSALLIITVLLYQCFS